MTIIIPMAGSGQRFVDAGYTVPKPLIRVGTKCLIEHVVGMFNPNDHFIFICNAHHAALPEMQARLALLSKRLRKVELVAMPEHKQGPVYTVSAAFDLIPGQEQAMVAYCDGVVPYNPPDFQKHVSNLDGCLFTHTGFHPHTLSATRMAFIREVDGHVLEVKEKASYTDSPEKEHASSGLYWFKTGEMLKHYFQRAMSENENIAHNGEYYVTLVYNIMIGDDCSVGYYDTEFVAILGTPHEVENYEAWRKIVQNPYLTNDQHTLSCYEYWQRFDQKHGLL